MEVRNLVTFLKVTELKSFSRAAEALGAGALVGIPTETVYGLGADALNPEAVARIFEAKGRPSLDPAARARAGRAAL